MIMFSLCYAPALSFHPQNVTSFPTSAATSPSADQACNPLTPSSQALTQLPSTEEEEEPPRALQTCKRGHHAIPPNWTVPGRSRE
ncbi:hypothetical protein ILYODFUR_018221 [Ilyodon furcidens]|uniref:Uncharacterized protein n=1 Tax=Ilyodon furcidens TaxID=33524 RepID=A0ABV0VF17_9TELE